MNHTFTLSDNGLNSFGFRVLTSGINLDLFKKNPVMLYYHDGYSLPIGRWENLRVEDDKLLADAVFDMEDPEAVKIAGKVERGFLKGVSVGLTDIVKSDESSNILPGQVRPTVIQSTLFEASIVPIPSNGNALKMKHGGDVVCLSDGDVSVLSDLLPEIKITNSPKNMEKIAQKLNLSANASEDDILLAIDKLNSDISSLKDGKGEIALNAGKVVGLVNKDNEESLTKLAKADPDAFLSFLETQKDQKPQQKEDGDLRATEILKLMKDRLPSENQESPANKFDRLQKEDPDELLRLKREQPEEFNKLYSAYMGKS